MLVNRFSYYYSLVVLLMCAGFSSATLAAEAGLRLTQTRIVFEAGSPNTKVTLKNGSQQVYLIKADVMNTAEGNGQEKAPPFIMTPPMFRLEKESANTVLVVRNGTAELPTDRESVFYLSFLAIPAITKAGNSAENMTSAQISVGIRSVIKLFYRPKGLPMDVESAQSKLTFHQIGQQLDVSNPTPYYLTLAQLQVNQQPLDVREFEPMIAPFSTQRYPVKGNVTHVKWSVITDYGDMSAPYQAVISVEGKSHETH